MCLYEILYDLLETTPEAKKGMSLVLEANTKSGWWGQGWKKVKTGSWGCRKEASPCIPVPALKPKSFAPAQLPGREQNPGCSQPLLLPQLERCIPTAHSVSHPHRCSHAPKPSPTTADSAGARKG